MINQIDKHNQAILLRQSGVSIRSIAKKLIISSSTASLWCRHILLNEEQLQQLKSRPKDIERLRLLSKKRHLDKINRHQKIHQTARNNMKPMTDEEFFKAGLALYWAEGFKNISEGRIGFCNSDPRMITFMIAWFKKILNVPIEDFTLRAEFNIEHLARKDEIELYWSNLTKIPLSQFNKPYLQKSKVLRDYSKKGTYYGVLRIRIRKSLAQLVQIRGWIDGMSASIG